jgi:hypothetical protein
MAGRPAAAPADAEKARTADTTVPASTQPRAVAEATEPPAEAPAAAAPAPDETSASAAAETPAPTERPAPAETPPASADPDAAGGDLERLRRGWSEVVATVSKSPPLKPLIESCRPIGVEGTIVTLGFPEEKDFLREAAERKRAGIEAGIAAFLGHPVGVRCVVSNLDLLPPLPDDGDAAHILAEAQRIFAEDIADVREVT